MPNVPGSGGRRGEGWSAWGTPRLGSARPARLGRSVAGPVTLRHAGSTPAPDPPWHLPGPPGTSLDLPWVLLARVAGCRLLTRCPRRGARRTSDTIEQDHRHDRQHDIEHGHRQRDDQPSRSGQRSRPLVHTHASHPARRSLTPHPVGCSASPPRHDAGGGGATRVDRLGSGPRGAGHAGGARAGRGIPGGARAWSPASGADGPARADHR